MLEELEATEPKTIANMVTPEEHWLKGSIGAFRPDQFHLFLDELHREHGSIYKIHFLNKPVVVIADPTIAEGILKNRPHLYRRYSRIEPVFRELGVQGAFSAEGDEWARHRKLLNPAFKPSQIKTFFPTLKTVTNNLCSVLGQIDEDFDFQQLIERYSVDITTLLAFGYNLNSLGQGDSELQRALALIFPRISARLKAPIPYWRYFKLDVDRKVDQAMKVVQKHVRVFIQSARDNLQKNPTPQNILESLVHDHSGDESDIIGNTITLLLAGEDTTANTIAWCIDYLASDQSLQDRIFQEIQSNYPVSGELTWEDLDKFPLVLGAIQESLRLKPVAPFVYLEPKEDVEVHGYSLPKGTMMTILLSPNNKSEEVFESAQTFNPERWLDLSETDKKRYANELKSFGAGPRLCPGMQLAFVEMKLALIEMLRLYKFDRANNSEGASESFEFTLKPKGLLVTVSKRNG